MKKSILLSISILTLAVVLGTSLLYFWSEPLVLAGEDYFEDEIFRFEQQDKINFPAPNAIVFVGSSSIRLWHTLAEDMAPLQIIRRGFGGAHMSHVLHYFDRVVLPYKPRAVVLFVGGNDIGSGQSAEQLLAEYEEFRLKLEYALPDADLWILAMKPSKLRWGLRHEMKKVDAALKTFANGYSHVHFVETGSVLLNSQGLPDDVFIDDGLHLNSDGYRRWTQKLKPLLVKSYSN